MPINISQFISAFTDAILGSKVYQVAGSMQALVAASTTSGGKSPYWNLVLDSFNPTKLVTDVVNLVKASADSSWTTLNTGGVINTIVGNAWTTLNTNGIVFSNLLLVKTLFDVGGNGLLMISKVLELLNISTAKLQHLKNILNDPVDALKTNLYRLVEYFLNTYTEEPA